MAKSPPAFQFYPADFLGATSTWEPEEVGVYIKLLCSQWINGTLPGDVSRLSKVAGCSEKKFNKTFEVVGCKFESDGIGRIINLRLEEVRKQQVDFQKKQQINGKKGGRPRKPK